MNDKATITLPLHVIAELGLFGKLREMGYQLPLTPDELKDKLKEEVQHTYEIVRAAPTPERSSKPHNRVNDPTNKDIPNVYMQLTEIMEQAFRSADAELKKEGKTLVTANLTKRFPFHVESKFEVDEVSHDEKMMEIRLTEPAPTRLSKETIEGLEMLAKANQKPKE